MVKLFSLAERVKGSSHELNGKPCQDSTMKWSSNDGSIHILVLSDGHGGDTYVRSDLGSRLACEITIELLKHFAEDTAMTKCFLDRAGSLTARPWKNPLISENGKPIKYESLEESQQEIVRQNKSYADSLVGIEPQNQVLSELFKKIYDSWFNAININFEENPLNNSEKELLGHHNIEKAYGCTLLAYLQTPLYWLAFQIGDGKILTCDRNLRWTEPVPWDCRCFLNITTSLCDSLQPWNSFRFAFNGKGEFPVGVYMGSDGIDDSWGTPDRLKKFYSQITEIFVKNSDDADSMIPELINYLSKLSRDASHDDMSIAALLNLDALRIGVDLFKLRIKGREIHERIANIEQKIAHHLQEIEGVSAMASIRQKTLFLLDELKRLIANKELSQNFSVDDWQLSVDDFCQKVKVNYEQACEEKKERDNLKQQEIELKEQHDGFVQKNSEFDNEDLKKWKNFRDDWLAKHQEATESVQNEDGSLTDDKNNKEDCSDVDVFEASHAIEDQLNKPDHSDEINSFKPIERNRALTEYIELRDGFLIRIKRV